MKVMVISDIHGNVEKLNKAIERYYEEEANWIFILGDFSNYFSSFSDDEIAQILNNRGGKVFAIRGNCDTEDFEKMLDFKLTDVKTIEVNGIKVTFSHGHLYNFNRLPPECGDIFIQGHTHCGGMYKVEDRIFANCGSISKPRGGSVCSYILLSEEAIFLKSLEGEVLQTINLK